MAEGDAPCGRRLGPPKTARGSAPSPKRRRRQAQSGPCPSARPEETGQLPKAPGTGGRPGPRAAARPGAGEPRRREKGGVVSAGWRCQSVSGWSPCPGPSSGCGRLPTKVCARVEMGREVAAEAEPSSSAPPSVSGTLPAPRLVLTSVYPLTSCLTIAGTQAAAAANAWRLTSPP